MPTSRRLPINGLSLVILSLLLVCGFVMSWKSVQGDFRSINTFPQIFAISLAVSAVLFAAIAPTDRADEVRNPSVRRKHHDDRDGVGADRKERWPRGAFSLLPSHCPPTPCTQTWPSAPLEQGYEAALWEVPGFVPWLVANVVSWPVPYHVTMRGFVPGSFLAGAIPYPEDGSSKCPR